VAGPTGPTGAASSVSGPTGPTGPTGATPAIGGSNTQVQYNNSGSLAGSSNFVFTGTLVGIGTTSPKAYLTVQVPSNLTNVNLIPENGSANSYSNGIGFNVGFNGTNWTTQGDGSNSGGSYVGCTYGDSAIKFVTVPNAGGTGQTISDATFQSYERARVDVNGYLLVGYTSSNGAYRLQVNSQIFATSSTIATSDAKYKQNVETLTDGLDVIKSLRPVSFDWKQHPIHNFDTDNRIVGFLAQEVQQALSYKPYIHSIVKKSVCVLEPEIKDENGAVITNAVTEEFLGIAEGNMIALLTAAIKELSAKNDDLETRIIELEKK
jgi:hypothetical protein